MFIYLDKLNCPLNEVPLFNLCMRFFSGLPEIKLIKFVCIYIGFNL